MKDKLSRIANRPDPRQWGEHELMTLAEAAALMWPDGLLTETSLRTAVRDGRLPISKIAGKFLTTRAALSTLTICERLSTAHTDARAPKVSGPDGRYLADLHKLEAMSQGARRARRAAAV